MFLRKYFLSALIFFGVVVLYIHNLSRSVYGGDVGDLISAASVGGIAHPPGYPLFSLVGFLLTRLSFLSLPQAFLVGLISAVSGAAGVTLFYYLAVLLTKSKLVALLGSLTIAFSFLYWFYAEIAEVFAFNALFAIFLFLLAFLYRKSKKKKILFAFVSVLALSFCNHQTIILIVPSLVLLVAGNAINLYKKDKKAIWQTGIFFLVGLLPLLYIPIAASFHPLINWDNVHDIQSFLHLIFRQDYGTFKAGILDQVSLMQRIIILQAYLQYIIIQFTIPVVLCSLLGFISLFKKDRTSSLSLILAFLLSGPLFIVYAGFPLNGSFYMGVYERFFLLSTVILLIPFPIGVLWIADLLGKIVQGRSFQKAFIFVFFLIPIFLFFYNYEKTNLSQISVGDNLAYDMLSPLPPDSVLIFSGDTIVFNTWYVHYVKKFRPDILIYNIGGGLEGGSFNNTMVAAQKKYAKRNRTDALLNVIKELRRTHRVFSTVTMQPTKGDKITWIPYGLSYAYVNSDIDMPSHDLYLRKINSIWEKLHPLSPEDLQKKVFHNVTIAEFPSVYSNAALAVGTFLYSQYHDDENALVYYKKALILDPTNPKAYLTLGVYYTGQDGKCQDVISDLSTSISLDQFQKLPYFLLYNAYTKCVSDKKYANGIKEEFYRVFQQDFFQEIKKETSL